MELRKDRGCSSTKKIKRQWAVFKTLHRKLNIEQYKPIFDCAIIHSRIYTNINKNIFEDTNEVIRIRKSKKNRQYNGQKKRDKKTNNDLQNTTQKTKDRATLIHYKPEVNSDVPEGYAFDYVMFCFFKWIIIESSILYVSLILLMPSVVDPSL